MLAVPVGRHTPVCIEHTVRRRVHHRERLHDGAGIKEVDLQPTAAHLVDLGDIVPAVIAEDVSRAEAALHLQGDGLRARNLRHGDSRHAGDSGSAEELAASRSVDCLFFVILLPSLGLIYSLNNSRRVLFHDPTSVRIRQTLESQSYGCAVTGRNIGQLPERLGWPFQAPIIRPILCANSREWFFVPY